MTTSDDAPCAPAATSSCAAQKAITERRILCMGGSDRGREDGFLVVVAAPGAPRKCPFLNCSTLVPELVQTGRRFRTEDLQRGRRVRRRSTRGATSCRSS